MPLTDQQVLYFKDKLLNMRHQLTGLLQGVSREVKRPEDSTGYSQHQADQGSDDFDRAIQLELTTKEYGLLKRIDRALQKIEEQTYGICDVSEEEIPLARLEALPYATMTVKAQEKLEKGLL